MCQNLKHARQGQAHGKWSDRQWVQRWKIRLKHEQTCRKWEADVVVEEAPLTSVWLQREKNRAASPAFSPAQLAKAFVLDAWQGQWQTWYKGRESDRCCYAPETEKLAAWMLKLLYSQRHVLEWA
jgi:hypothetical protein